MCVNNKKEEGERERWEIRDESNLSVSGGVDVERRWLEEGGGLCGCLCNEEEDWGGGETLKGMSQPGACCASFNINKAPPSLSVYLSPRPCRVFLPNFLQSFN